DRYRLADLAGDSRAIRRVRDLIAQVSSSSRSLCIHGEAGAGKTRAARAIHPASPRSSGPFVALMSTSMPEAAVDARLLGCQAAADESIGGAVSRAQMGTLFVDDVGDLGPRGQKRILELMRDRVCERPDGVRVSVNVRIVAATTRDLAQRVSDG